MALRHPSPRPPCPPRPPRLSSQVCRRPPPHMPRQPRCRGRSAPSPTAPEAACARRGACRTGGRPWRRARPRTPRPPPRVLPARSVPGCCRLGCHGTWYVRHGRGWHVYGVRTVVPAPGAGCPAPLIRTARRRTVRVARTYSTEAPGRTCKLRSRRSRSTAMRSGSA
eukprot:scaffold30059_cov63-Phaeocystis_antarctica.AAC.2